jgi:hypothetical protein
MRVLATHIVITWCLQDQRKTFQEKKAFQDIYRRHITHIRENHAVAATGSPLLGGLLACLWCKCCACIVTAVDVVRTIQNHHQSGTQWASPIMRHVLRPINGNTAAAMRNSSNYLPESALPLTETIRQENHLLTRVLRPWKTFLRDNMRPRRPHIIADVLLVVVLHHTSHGD